MALTRIVGVYARTWQEFSGRRDRTRDDHLPSTA
jgi:hypothetical protein